MSEYTSKDQLIVSQAENDVMSSYQLTDSRDFFQEYGLNKSASFSDDDQALYDYTVEQTLVKLAEAGVTVNNSNEPQLTAEDVANLIVKQAHCDALSMYNLSEPVDVMAGYGLNKSANWPEECQDLYSNAFIQTEAEIAQMNKSASHDPLQVAAQAYMDEITGQVFGHNLKKIASAFELEYLNIQK